MKRPLPLAEELAVELLANGERVAMLMCTPRDLDDLAVGHLFARGMLAEPERVLSVSSDAEVPVMSVIAPGAVKADSFGLGTVMASGHGLKPALNPVAEGERLPPGFSVSMAALRLWSGAMFEAAILYRQTGGMHCAALALPGEAPEPTLAAKTGQTLANVPVKGRDAGAGTDAMPTGLSFFAVREDVGRHNALDKVLGRGFMSGADFSRAVILTSGRIASDMMLKAVAARVPVVVSRSIPTTSAYTLARQYGITVVGRIGDDEPIVYTCPDRIRFP